MRKFKFEIETEDDVIVLVARANGNKVLLALDTAASHSIIDFNMLLMIGYSPQQAVDSTMVETSNGIMSTQIFQLDTLEILDKTATSFEVMSYDFLEKGILSEYNGVLGLDFLKNTILTIDFIKNEVWLND